MQYYISESLFLKYTTSRLLEYTQTLMQLFVRKMVTNQLPAAYSKRMLTKSIRENLYAARNSELET
jgi:hypothetical protein